MKLCGRPLNLGRTCTQLVGKDGTHVGGCQGETPQVFKDFANSLKMAERESMMLGLIIGIELRNYDPRYLQNRDHVDQSVDYHVARLKLELLDSQLQMLKDVAFQNFKV